MGPFLSPSGRGKPADRSTSRHCGIWNFPAALSLSGLRRGQTRLERAMRKFLIASASVAAVALMPGLSFAQDVVVEPDVETWVMEQPAPSVTLDEDVVIGGVLPDTVQVIEVPKYKKY